MEDWVFRALQRWPNVPALYGWLRLDRRGRWLIRGEPISRPQIVDTINPNYAADERGGWYFQNGPQRGYVALDYAPLLFRAEDDGRLRAHTGSLVGRISAACLDEHGAVSLMTDLGPGLVDDQDLDWVLSRLDSAADDGGADALERALERALTQPTGERTDLRLRTAAWQIPLERCDFDHLPERLGFVREPRPDD